MQTHISLYKQKKLQHTKCWQHIVAKSHHSDGLLQERRNSSALAMDLRLSCIKPSIYHYKP